VAAGVVGGGVDDVGAVPFDIFDPFVLGVEFPVGAPPHVAEPVPVAKVGQPWVLVAEGVVAVFAQSFRSRSTILAPSFAANSWAVLLRARRVR
jgi:hypothetical protein